MKKNITFKCEVCGKEFDNFYDRAICKASHIKSYECYSNEELIEIIDDLLRRAYDYRIGISVMGMHIKSFENLMSEVAKRLKEMEE